MNIEQDNKKYKYELDKRIFGLSFAEALKPFGKKVLSIKATYIHLVTFSKDKAKKKYDHWFYIHLDELGKKIPSNKKTTGINLSILKDLGLIFVKKNPGDIDFEEYEGLKNLRDEMKFVHSNTIFLKVFQLSDDVMDKIQNKAKEVSRQYKNKCKTSERSKVYRIQKKAIERGDLTKEEMDEINKNAKERRNSKLLLKP